LVINNISSCKWFTKEKKRKKKEKKEKKKNKRGYEKKK
jgi:hypothetical protein